MKTGLSPRATSMLDDEWGHSNEKYLMGDEDAMNAEDDTLAMADLDEEWAI